MQINLAGAGKIAPEGTAITLSGTDLAAQNTVEEPRKIAPVTTTATGLGPTFTYTFAPYSVTVLVLKVE